ncbi:MAG: hypothetical protein HKO61_13855 [Flavobacteriaceae bacterium]|nr:hypothetical protein [Flavobacteriaceae bacterium]NNM10251.1 hypothetical protein [Flavobacteriaceae bacterium]
MFIKRKFNLKYSALLVIIVVLISGFTTPERTGKRIIKYLMSGKVEKIEKYLMEKSEFIDFVNSMSRKPGQEQINIMLENYEEAQEAYLLDFVSLNDEAWGDLQVDRIEYEYQIGKPGKDETISWPESKDYEPKNSPDEQLKVNFSFHLKSDNKKYLGSLDMINYKGKWKLFHLLKPFTITEVD